MHLNTTLISKTQNTLLYSEIDTLNGSLHSNHGSFRFKNLAYIFGALTRKKKDNQTWWNFVFEISFVVLHNCRQIYSVFFFKTRLQRRLRYINSFNKNKIAKKIIQTCTHKSHRSPC